MAAVRLWRKRDEEKRVCLGFFYSSPCIILDVKLRENGFDGGDLTITFDCIQMLLQKVAQLEEALTQKDKFIHSSRMIVKFREDHISRLEKKLKEGQCLLSPSDSQALTEQLKEEIKILRDQVKDVLQ